MRVTFLALWLATIPAGVLSAQTTAIEWSSITGGFGDMAGGDTRVQASVGQPMAGEGSDAGGSVSGGFFAGAGWASGFVTTMHFGPGWNLISLPLRPADPRKDSLFPDALSSAFAFDGQYTASESLAIGKGYWLKHPGPMLVGISGAVATAETVAVKAGWNLVGAIGAPVPVASIGSNPPSAVVSNFFGFSGQYDAVDTLQPGRGYWVKVASAGSLYLTSPGGATVPTGR